MPAKRSASAAGASRSRPARPLRKPPTASARSPPSGPAPERLPTWNRGHSMIENSNHHHPRRQPGQGRLPRPRSPRAGQQRHHEQHRPRHCPAPRLPFRARSPRPLRDAPRGRLRSRPLARLASRKSTAPIRGAFRASRRPPSPRRGEKAATSRPQRRTRTQPEGRSRTAPRRTRAQTATPPCRTAPRPWASRAIKSYIPFALLQENTRFPPTRRSSYRSEMP